MILNKKGLSIIQVVVMGAVLAGLAAYMVKKQKSVTKLMNSNVVREDISRITSQLRQVVSNVTSCQGDFLTQIQTLYGGASTTASLANINIGAPYGIILSDGETFGVNGKIEIDEIELEKGDVNNMNLNIYININDANSFLARTASNNLRLLRQLPLNIKRDYLGNISGCYTDPGGEIEDGIYRFCQGRGAIFDEDTRSCRIIALDSSACPAGEIMVGLDFNGTDPNDPKMVPRCASNFSAAENLNCPSGQILRGIDASGEAVCDTLTSDDIQHLMNPSQVAAGPAGYETCDGQSRLTVNGSYVEIDCNN